MSEWASKERNIIDCHVHMYGIEQEARLLEIKAATGIARMNLLGYCYAGEPSWLPPALAMKARHPRDFYVFAGLDHARRLTNGNVAAPPLDAQVDRFVALGCDGIKMLEGKPTSRQRLDVAFDDPYYADYFARVEEAGLPMLWHVNDPEEFWDPERIPHWAKERRWGYGPDDVQKEQLYAEVEWVLERYPDLKIIFAHFYFLSADLPRATRFLEEHPNVHFDLAPGVEMLYNISRNPEAGREFFIHHADRIVFGTDLWSGIGNEQGILRAGLVFRWLETDDEFRVPDGADFLLGPPEDGIVRGLRLPKLILDAIYRGNLARVAGPVPRPLNLPRVIEECNRLAAIAEAVSGKPASETEAGKVAEVLAG